MKPEASGIEVVSLRHVAARFISKNEQDGLEELGAITSALFKEIQLRYRLWAFASGLAAIMFGLAVAISLFTTFALPSQSALATAVTGLIGLIWAAVIFLWHCFQYGFRPVKKVLPAKYANPDSPAAKNIDLFFSVLQPDTKLKAFYLTRVGLKRYVGREYFFGRFRVLMLSEDDKVRGLMFPPRGMWFEHELFIEVDITVLLALAKAKPNEGGRPVEIDYTAILLRIIERPSLQKILPNVYTHETQLMNLIKKECLANDDENYKGVRIPEPTQLRAFAKEILAAIKKNRKSKN